MRKGFSEMILWIIIAVGALAISLYFVGKNLLGMFS